MNKRAGDIPALRDTPIFFETLANLAHCSPADAAEHYGLAKGINGFLDEYATKAVEQ